MEWSYKMDMQRILFENSFVKKVPLIIETSTPFSIGWKSISHQFIYLYTIKIEKDFKVKFPFVTEHFDHPLANWTEEGPHPPPSLLLINLVPFH